MKQKLILLTVLLAAFSAFSFFVDPVPLPSYYTLTVNSGTGGGSYTDGTLFLITASNAPTGQAFDRWTGDTQYVDSVTSASPAVTMPAKAIALTATYTNLPGWYTLTVTNGTGSGVYTNGTWVEIAPDAPPTGKAFSQWTDEAGAYLTSDANSTVIMPARDSSVTATYTNLPGWYTLTVTNGTGSGAYSNGTYALITASNAPTGQAFDRWIGDTQYVDSVVSTNATVTMPTNAVSLTAAYTNLPGWYTLTVTNGTAGSGPYTNGQQVAIMADAPIAGKAFSQWTGDTQYVASVTSSNTAVTMPAQDVFLTAAYVDVYYALTVTNGTGGGTYTNGTQVLITASNSPAGQVFDQWTGDTQVVASVTSSTTTVSMSAQAVVLTATYKTVYALTVTNGTGSGSYTNGQRVTIAADAPAPRKTFDRWTGDTQYVARVTSSNTTVTMPARAIALTATYKDASYSLIITGGSGGGSYTNARVVPITANAPVTGRAFDRWTGDTQYVASVTSTSTTVTMPTNAVSLTATYTNLPGWYTLAVTNGTGNGTSNGAYTNGTLVAVVANNASARGKAFVQWTGGTQYVASVTSSNTTVTMPAQDISLTATYVDIYFTLTVNSGTGGGTYTNGTKVAVAADAPPIGMAFSQWTDEPLNSPGSTNLTITMPARDFSLTATYTNLPGWYTLTVTNGTGSGAYSNGTYALITASNAPTGQAFDRWVGDTQYVDSVASTNATVMMPTNAVSLTATYTNLPGWYTLTVTNGTGSGVYSNGTYALIIASNAPTGQAFDRWVGDTQYVDSAVTTNATVMMPTNAVSLTATYTNLPGWYTLTVNNGTGDGTYTNGTRVTIAADAPEFDRAFSRWIGATQYVAKVTSTTTTVTMPAANISVTATYGAARYYLDVYRGTGAGLYTNSQKVAIVFYPFGAIIPPGWVFDRWTGDTQYVANVTSTTTTVTMPPAPAVCIADFRDIQSPVLTVSSPMSGERVGGVVKVVGKVTDNDGAADIFIRLNDGGWMTNSVLLDTTRWTTNNQLITRWATNNGFSGTTSWATNDVLTFGAAINIIGPTTNNGMFGTTSWTNNLTLPFLLGTNVLQVYARDGTGNRSTTNTLKFVYVNAGNLTIQTNGPGTVTRLPAGVPEVGKTYTLTAVPSKTGSIFSNWTGYVTSTNKVVTFDMTNNVAITANFTDIQKPTVVITAPVLKQRILGTNGLFTVKGTAADNWALTNVLVQLNGGSWINVSTTNSYKNWSLPVELIPGTNTIRACSLDKAGYNSLTASVSCVYVVTGTLTIQTNGLGTVTRLPAGVPEVGKTYTLTAVPSKTGSSFSSWSGDSTSTNKVLSFTMTSNKTFTANFTDTQKPTVVITYPTRLQRVVTNGAVVIRGTAADNGSLGGVKYQLYTGEWTNAATTNVWKNWTATNFVPVSGLNTARVYSVDLQGNVSATSTVVFTYVPGAVMQVRTNGQGSVTPAYNGQMLEIGKSYKMTAKAKTGYVFTAWADGTETVTNTPAITFVMQSNLVLTANFRSLTKAAMADIAVDTPTPQATIVVDGSVKDWANVQRSSFSYASVTQEVAVALDGNSIALLLKGCPFGTSDTVLVYFKLRLSYGSGDNRHSVDLWTSGSVLYGMVDGQVITGLEAVLLNGVLEVKLPVEQAPSQVTIEEIGCGMDLGGGTLTELFRLIPPPALIL